MLLQETLPQTVTTATQYLSKLKNMKLHLTELLNKKIRLELEIKLLKKTITNKQTDYQNSLKLKLQLNSVPLSPEEGHKLLLENPVLFGLLLEFDQVERELQELLEEVTEDNILS